MEKRVSKQDQDYKCRRVRWKANPFTERKTLAKLRAAPKLFTLRPSTFLRAAISQHRSPPPPHVSARGSSL